MTKVKSQYFSDLIDKNFENLRRLWNTINKIIHRTPAVELRESNNVKSLCEHFAKYVCDIGGRGHEDQYKVCIKIM